MKEMTKKGDKSLSPNYKKAKMSMLEALKSEMSGMMGDDLKGLKKITVASPDKEGLKEGLDKAEEMLDKSEDAEEGEVCPECGMKHEDGMHKMPDGEMMSDEDMPLEEIEAKIKELEKLKMKKMME